MRIQGKTALVTGGSAGIGRQTALLLAAKGAKVIIVARDKDRAEQTVAHYPDRITPLLADLARTDGQEKVIAQVQKRWPELAILVNNAGIQINMAQTGVGDDGRMSDFRTEIEVNLAAPVALSFGLMPILAERKRAAIVNISSGLALVPKRTAPVYCATKAALRVYTRALRYRCEDAAPSIKAIDVIMTLVETGMTTGRGRRKMSAEEAARVIVKGIEKEQSEIWVGLTRMLGHLQRLWPRLAYRILRNG